MFKLIQSYISKGTYTKDDLLQLILTHIIEPQLEKDVFSIIYDFPQTQAALAKCSTKKGQEVAERFEVYYGGMELANGYHELDSSKEQKKRFLETLKQRKKAKKETYPLDSQFLAIFII